MEINVYTKCMKNHAAAFGLFANDGCQQFYSSYDSLWCGACGCHRNFHEKTTVVQLVPPPVPEVQDLVAFMSDEDEDQQDPHEMEEPPLGLTRYWFNEEQTSAILHFAQDMQWSLRNRTANEVEEFCAAHQIEIRKFKVWMSTNKKKYSHQVGSSSGANNI